MYVRVVEWERTKLNYYLQTLLCTGTNTLHSIDSEKAYKLHKTRFFANFSNFKYFFLFLFFFVVKLEGGTWNFESNNKLYRSDPTNEDQPESGKYDNDNGGVRKLTMTCGKLPCNNKNILFFL